MRINFECCLFDRLWGVATTERGWTQGYPGQAWASGQDQQTDGRLLTQGLQNAGVHVSLLWGSFTKMAERWLFCILCQLWHMLLIFDLSVEFLIFRLVIFWLSFYEFHWLCSFVCCGHFCVHLYIWHIDHWDKNSLTLQKKHEETWKMNNLLFLVF